jgi:hypothetical protein
MCPQSLVFLGFFFLCVFFSFGASVAVLWRLGKRIQHGTMQSIFFVCCNVMSGLSGYRGFVSGVRSLGGTFFILAGILLH